MKKLRCRLCSEWFEPNWPGQHVCDACWDEEPEDLAALKARIEDKVRRRLEGT